MKSDDDCNFIEISCLLIYATITRNKRSSAQTNKKNLKKKEKNINSNALMTKASTQRSYK